MPYSQDRVRQKILNVSNESDRKSRLRIWTEQADPGIKFDLNLSPIIN
jgi:hypothetical protein